VWLQLSVRYSSAGGASTDTKLAWCADGPQGNLLKQEWAACLRIDCLITAMLSSSDVAACNIAEYDTSLLNLDHCAAVPEAAKGRDCAFTGNANTLAQDPHRSGTSNYEENHCLPIVSANPAAIIGQCISECCLQAQAANNQMV